MVSRILLRRYVTVAAALATAVLAILVPAAGTAAPEFDRAPLVRELNAAIADEERALQLLAKSPPRRETARLALDRSRMRLHEILEDYPPPSLPGLVVGSVADARNFDESVMKDLATPGSLAKARKKIEYALRRKHQASGSLLPPPSTGGSQCSDGRDNDGDRLVDARYDAGCTNARDGSEGSPLTCSLEYAPRGSLYVVQGTCSGVFFKVEISAPQGAEFNTKQPPVVVQDRACWFADARTLDCVMGDGDANPGHVLDIRWREQSGPATTMPLKVWITDFSGRRQRATLEQKPSPPPAETPFSLGKEPVAAVGTFNGQDVCPGIATSFTQTSEWLAPGTGTLTITDATGRKVSGPIKPGGSFDVRGVFAFRSGGESFSESYVGKITGNTATATYKYTTASGCLSTYAVSFVLKR